MPGQIHTVHRRGPFFMGTFGFVPQCAWNPSPVKCSNSSTIIVWKLDRLGRSLKELFTMINDFQSRDIGFRSLNDAAPRWPSILPPLKAA